MSESDEDYQRRALQVFADVEYGPKHVLTATDAEILVLDGPDARRVTPLLSVDATVSEQQRALITDEASKRLFTDGRAEDGTPLGGQDSNDPEPTVRTVLRLRRSWLCLLVINQETALSRQFKSVYLRADRLAMVEIASRDGRHHFSVMKRAAALDATAEELAPVARPTDDGFHGRTYATSTWPDDAHDTLAQAKIASTMVSRRQTRAMDRRTEDRFAVYNFDDHTEILHPEPPGRVRIAPISRHALRERLETITAPIDNATQGQS